MDNQPDIAAPAPEQAKKPNRMIWLWILVPFVCLGLCVVVAAAWILFDPTVFNLFKTGDPQVKISAGTYEGTVYTAPEKNFTCDFSSVMVSGLNPVLQATQDVEKGTGTVFTMNDFGNEYGVDYFKIAKGGDDLTSSLSDPSSKQDALKSLLENLLLPARGPHAEIAHQEEISDDILFAVINNPEASYLVAQTNGVTTPLGFEEGYYIFSGKDWFYFTYFFLTPTDASKQIGPADMQKNVEEFYQRCHFTS